MSTATEAESDAMPGSPVATVRSVHVRPPSSETPRTMRPHWLRGRNSRPAESVRMCPCSDPDTFPPSVETAIVGELPASRKVRPPSVECAQATRATVLTQ